MSQSASWPVRRALVTGSTGFIGSRLAEALLELESEVVGIVRNLTEVDVLELRGIGRE